MSKSPTWLLNYACNDFSQCGEDGILSRMLEIIPAPTRWCVEFGAWDGRYMSNTCRLTEHCGYSGVLIEGNKERAAALKQQHAGNPHIVPIHRFVGFGCDDNLDVILRDTPIPEDFDVLSIDIDGNDYHVWKATEDYRPRIVVIEFNPTIPTEVSFVQAANQRVSQGCSLRALTDLGKAKGYELVCVTFCNAIFVRSEYFSLFNISDNRPETLRTDLSAVTWIFCGYDGRVILDGNRTLPWHKLTMRESSMQQLPRIFHGHPHSTGRVRRAVYKVYKAIWNSLGMRDAA